jgi:UrcA family protein
MSITLKTLAAALALSIAAPAALADKAEKAPNWVAMTVVEYGDLDISKEAGAQALLSRITHASKKICGKRPGTVMNGALERHLNCRATVIGDTVKRINQPNLTLAWQADTGAVVQTASR